MKVKMPLLIATAFLLYSIPASYQLKHRYLR